MVIEMNKDPILDHTERYQAAGYEPYDQLYGYAMHENDQYITKFGGTREIVTKMDVNDVKFFLKHYKEHK